MIPEIAAASAQVILLSDDKKNEWNYNYEK
jgi:hypothetical protein